MVDRRISIDFKVEMSVKRNLPFHALLVPYIVSSKRTNSSTMTTATTGDPTEPLLGIPACTGTVPPPPEVFHAVYVAPPAIRSPGENDPSSKTPTVIYLDLEAGQDRKEREKRREVKRLLVAITMALGFCLGLLINLAGFGGEQLFMVLLGLRNGIDLCDNFRAKIVTIAFWSTFTIASLLVVRTVVLTMLEKILQALYANSKASDHTTTKSTDSSKETNIKFAPWMFGDDDKQDDVSHSLDYLDDKFLLATCIGSSLIGCLTNLYIGLYWSFIGQLVGTLAVVGIDKFIMKKRKSRFYEKRNQ